MSSPDWSECSLISMDGTSSSALSKKAVKILGPTLAFLIFGYVPVVFLTTFWPPLSLYVPRLLGY